MAVVINEKRMVDDNITSFENRMNSKAIRFVDHTQTYTCYYHIINPDTTTDDGFVDIESLVGARSPIRFQRIDNFPLYGIESLVPQLQDTDYGLDSSIEGEAIIMPGTIKPLQNSFFVIKHLKIPAVFRITEISYDNVRPDNYYQIHYKLEFIDEERIQQLESKVLEDCECILENIGSEQRCIVKSVDFIQIQKIEAMRDDIVSTYIDIFYDKTHNSLIARKDQKNWYVYDPFLTYFINTHGLLNTKNSLNCYMLSDQFNDPRFSIKYERSLYRMIERQEPALVNRIPYNMFPASSNENSTFHFYYTYDVVGVDLVDHFNGNPVVGMDYIFSDEIAEKIRNGETTDNPYLDLIIKYIHKQKIGLYDIPLDLHQEIIKLHNNLEMYFFTPIIVFIINQTLLQN